MRQECLPSSDCPGEGFSVNLNCLELPAEVVVTVEQFDGQNWELHAGELQQLSRED